jgi:hypothetical protein
MGPTSGSSFRLSATAVLERLGNRALATLRRRQVRNDLSVANIDTDNAVARSFKPLWAGVANTGSAATDNNISHCIYPLHIR